MVQYQIGEGLNGAGRVLTKFQINLVIPENMFTLYFNRGRDILNTWDFYYIFSTGRKNKVGFI